MLKQNLNTVLDTERNSPVIAGFYIRQLKNEPLSNVLMLYPDLIIAAEKLLKKKAEDIYLNDYIQMIRKMSFSNPYPQDELKVLQALPAVPVYLKCEFLKKRSDGHSLSDTIPYKNYASGNCLRWLKIISDDTACLNDLEADRKQNMISFRNAPVCPIDPIGSIACFETGALAKALDDSRNRDVFLDNCRYMNRYTQNQAAGNFESEPFYILADSLNDPEFIKTMLICLKVFNFM